MEDELLEIINAMEKAGESQTSIAEVVQAYESNNATSPKGVQAKGESGELESPLADTTSSLDSSKTNQLYADKVTQNREKFMNNFSNVKKDENNFEDVTGENHKYDPKTQTIHTDPITGKARVIDAPYESIKTTLTKQILDKSGIDINVIKNLGDDKKIKHLLSETEDFVENYINETGDGKSPLKTASEMSGFNDVLGKQSADDIIKMSGINVNKIADDFKNKIHQESDNMPFYKYEYTDKTGIMKNYGDRDKTRNDVYTTEQLYKTNNEESLSNYGFDVNDFNGFLEEDGNKRLKKLQKTNVLANVTPAEKEFQQYKMLASYTKDRLNYLTGYKKNLDYKKKRGVKVNDSEYLKVNNEINKIQKGLGDYVKNGLPNFSQTLKEKKQKTIESYQEYKNGDKTWYQGIGRWTKGAYIGIENALADFGVFGSDIIGADNYAEEWRVSRNLDNLVESNDLLYSYVSGKKVSNKNGNFLVSNNGAIIDLDTKKNITSIAPDLGININKLKEEAKTGKKDYSFSLGNTASLSGGTIGNLALQMLLTKGMVGATALASEGIAAGKVASTSGMLIGGAMSYTNTFESTLQSLRDAGVSDDLAIEKATNVASIVGATTALTSSIAYNPRALKLISKSPEFKIIVKEAINLESQVGKKQAVKYLRDKTIKFLTGGLKEGTEEAVQENLENLSQAYANAKVNDELGKQILDQNISKDDIIQTAIMSFAPSFIIGGLGELKGELNNYDKKELYDLMSTDISKLDNILTTMVDNKYVTSDKANTLKSNVEKYLKYSNKVPKETTTEQLFNVIDLLDERNKLVNRKKNEDPAFHSKINEEIASVDEKIQKVYDEKTTSEETEPTKNNIETEEKTKQGEGKTKSKKKVGYNVSEQLKSHNDNEGSTFTLDGKNRSGEKGVSSVSIFPERSKIIDGKITEQDISEFKEANKDLLEGNEDVLAIGTWFDKKSGKTYLDVSAVTDTDSAIKLGEQYNQKAVFNLETSKEIDTKGDGTPIKNLKSEVDRVSDIRTILNESNKKSKKVQETAEGGTRTNKTGTDKSVDEDVQTSIKQIEKIDLSDKLGVNKVNDILNKLDNDLKKFGKETLGINLPVEVARGAIKAMKLAVGTAKTSLDITSAGMNYVQNTKWYKSLKKVDKEEFNKTGLVNKLNEVETELRKGYKAKDPSLKKTIREKTGQVDMSRKRLISEAKLLKDHFKALSKGAKEGSKHMEKLKNNFVDQIREITKGLGQDMKSSEVDQLINKVKKFNGKNLNEIKNEVKRILDKVEKRKEKLKYNSTLKKIVKKAVKVQKKKIGYIGKNILELARIRIKNIPKEYIENYYKIMKDVSEGKFIKKDVDALYNNLKKDIIKDVEARNKEREANRLKEPEDTSELIIDAKIAISKSYNTSLLNDSEKTILKKLKKLKHKYIEQLSAKKLKQIINNLDNLDKYGYLENKKINSIVTFLEEVETADEFKSKIGDKVLHLSYGLFQELNRIFGNKEQDIDTMVHRIQNRMSQHTDSLIKGVKGTIFYTHIIHPITSGLQTSTEKTLEIGNKLGSLIKKAKINKKFEFNVKLQLLFRQLEYNSNPSLRGDEVFKISKHIKATQELFNEGKSQYSKESINTINEIYEKYKNKDGEIDIDKLEKSLSPAEKQIVAFIKEHLSNTANERRDLDSNMLGENTLIIKDYFPRKNDKGVKRKSRYESYIKKVFNSSSVKSESSNERNANKANALDFTTLSHFMNHIKQSNIESHISPAMKRVGILLSQLQDSDNKSLVKVAIALEESIEKLIDIHMSKSIYATKSKNAKLIQTLLSKTFNKILMSNTRAVIDNLSQNATLLLFNADRIGDIRKSNEKMKDVRKKLMDDFNSIHHSRMTKAPSLKKLFSKFNQPNVTGGNRSLDFQEGMSSELSKSKWSEKNPSKSDKVIDLFNKNKISEAADSYAKIYYQVVDFSAKHFWDFHFMNKFKKITGQEFNPDKYINDTDYKIEYDKAIKQSIAYSDKQITNIYNTSAQSEQKLKVQIGSKNRDFKTRIDSFMQSFNFNENNMWWDSLMSTLGKEGGSIEDKKEAFRTFMIINTRALLYSYLSITLFDSVAKGLGILDDDDDDDKVQEKAIKRTLAQHVMLIGFGNKGAIFNTGAAYIFENWIHKNIIKSQGGKYNGYEDSLLYAQQERGSFKSHLGTLGAEGQLMQNVMDLAELSTNMMMEYNKKGEITVDDLIKYKAAKIGISTLAQMTGLPVNRAGKQWQNLMSNDLKNREKAIKEAKKRAKQKKSKKSIFAF